MSNNRDLVVIGGYPSTDSRKQILKDTILSLNQHFDILLVTHYPADIEIQSLVNYYIYDIRNEFFINENVYFYVHTPKFYLEYHYGENGHNHHSYAIYKSMMSAVSFIKDYYDGFYYVEGDSIFSKEDIEQLKNTKLETIKNNKEAFFFLIDNCIQTIFFYTKVDFFNKVFPICKTVGDYQNLCGQIGSFGVLENFFYCNLKQNNYLDNALLIQGTQVYDYFTNSKININRLKDDNNQLDIKLLKIKNTSDFAYFYMNSIDIVHENQYADLYINDEFIDTINLLSQYESNPLPSHLQSNNHLTIRLGNTVITYTKDQIINSNSFVEFK
jgi:hypothetical protein